MLERVVVKGEGVEEGDAKGMSHRTGRLEERGRSSF